jgi:type IV secretory pathway TraG/TraD family ATPase VirD4
LPADVRAFPRDEQLIFVAGCKPIRAKKLCFDQERIFRDRLRPASHERVTLTTHHDWVDVRPLGYLESRAAPKGRAAHGQGDLFAPATAKISDLALAGFRKPDGSRQAPPPNPPPAANEDSTTRKPRWTGV